MILKEGALYQDGHGDIKGPMHRVAERTFLDQYGGVFNEDGSQWNHVPESLGNLVKEIIMDKDQISAASPLPPMPETLAIQIEEALNTAIGVTAVHAPEVYQKIMAAALAFNAWINEES